MEDVQENMLPSSLPNQQLLSIDEELWRMAEERAQEILCIIQPNIVSEVNRKGVIDYVQRLIRDYYGAEVFPFGSVPLKTYLPDGDIDFTALSHENAEDELVLAVRSILENEKDPEYPIKDIQHIRAQVQLIKCTVKNIAVDISFNQMAGLYTLRFLEQVDQLVGKNHLFKRSIILIKAWCYYESRILGAHHGLLSTYAVEILVLYIINRFHSSARGPLEVLYRFLDYYSTFDWETYYVTIYGPQALSSLPEIVETPECDQSEFLLSKELLRNYRDMCSVPVRVSETTTHEFTQKHLNILDPLRSDNNLGRSVSRGNLHRIRFALSFGARKLKEILKLPGESMGVALEKFFMNTLDRNGKGQRPDVEVPVPAFGTGRSEQSDLRGDCDSYYGGLQYGQLYRNYAMPLTVHTSSPSSPCQADMHVLSTQQNWNVFYQMGPSIYVPTQTLYNPNASQTTYCLEDNVISRGTGTYIPDVTHNPYRDLHPRVSRPRRFAPVNHNVIPKSPQRKQPVEEVHSETEMNDKSRSFELLNEEFPFLPSTSKTSPSEDTNANSSSLVLLAKEFSLLPSICQTSPSEAQESVQLTAQAKNSSLSKLNFKLSNEEFPLLPSVRKTSPLESQGSVQLTGQARTSLSQLKIELSNEEFPPLPSISKISTSEGQESVQLTEKARNSSSPQLNIEFGTYSRSQSLTELSLPTKDEKKDSGVSSSGATMLVLPRVAMERKEEVPDSDEKTFIDSI